MELKITAHLQSYRIENHCPYYWSSATVLDIPSGAYRRATLFSKFRLENQTGEWKQAMMVEQDWDAIPRIKMIRLRRNERSAARSAMERSMRIYPSIAVKKKGLEARNIFYNVTENAAPVNSQSPLSVVRVTTSVRRRAFATFSLVSFFLLQILRCRYFSIISKHVRKDYNDFHLPNLKENVAWNLNGLVDSSTASKISIIKIVFDQNVRICYFARPRITGWLFS